MSSARMRSIGHRAQKVASASSDVEVEGATRRQARQHHDAVASARRCPETSLHSKCPPILKLQMKHKYMPLTFGFAFEVLMTEYRVCPPQSELER